MDIKQVIRIKGKNDHRGIAIYILEYYESTDSKSLMKKIKNIAAFQGILSPMKEVLNGWILDYNERYFMEDFPFGLKFIHDLAKEYGAYTPRINLVFDWGMKLIENSTTKSKN